MRTIIAHILLAAVLLQLLPAQQLCKVPVLFEHFYEHQQRDPQISIARFMAMHYLGEDENDDDTDRDMQLPFKKVNHQHVAQHQCCVPQQQLVFPVLISRYAAVNYPLLQDPALPHGCVGALFRPPIV